MPNRHATLRWILPLSRLWVILALAATLITAILTGKTLVMGFVDKLPIETILALEAGLIGLLAFGAFQVILYGVIRSQMAILTGVAEIDSQLTRVLDTADSQQQQLRRLAELGSMSDTAKALIFHEQEVEAVQEMVNACMLKQDYRRAEAIIKRMEDAGGYESEIKRLKDAVTGNIQSNEEGKLAAAAHRIRETIKTRNWSRAAREIARVEQVYPSHTQLIADLKADLNHARNIRKGELLKMYDQAVQRKDIDQSIEILRELDHYVTAAEVAALQESARGVFRAKLHSMGVSFSIAVNEQQWQKAVEIGEKIITGYPNSRMAEEVRQKFDALKGLATSSKKST